MLPIQNMPIRFNHSKRQDSIKYIVIHDTGNTDNGADVKAHFNYFNNGDRQASADYFVDDKMIGKFVSGDQKSWHCGDGRGRYGITNNNSIGVEMCVNSDGNRTIIFKNLIELTKYLMNEYNIPLDRVVRHYDASRKDCPHSMSANNWSEWYWFKKQLNEGSAPAPAPTGSYNGTVHVRTYLIVRNNPDGHQIGSIYNDERVQVVAGKNEWFKVIYDTKNGPKTKSGWVHKAYVSLDNNKDKSVHVNTYLIVRDNPDGNQIGSLYNNERVTVLESKGEWFNVLYDTKNGPQTKSGWAHSKYVY